MPHGVYSKADIRNKLMSAAISVSKNKIANALKSAQEAIGMIQDHEPTALGDRLDVLHEDPQPTNIQRLLTFAIGLVHEDEWFKAVTQINLSIALMRVRRDKKLEAINANNGNAEG